MHSALNYVVAGIPFHRELPGWLELRKEIPYPAGMTLRLAYRRNNRFIVPTECVIRKLPAPIPDIGRVYETNLVQFQNAIRPLKEVQDELLALANLRPLPDVPYDERDDAWYALESKHMTVRGALNAQLEDLLLLAVEAWIDMGDDGHTDFVLMGLLLIQERYYEQLVKDMIHGEPTWV